MRSLAAFSILTLSCGASSPPGPSVDQELTLDVARAPTTPATAPPPSNSASKSRNERPSALDTSSLTERETEELWRSLSDLPAPCDDAAVTLARCLNENRACAACLPAGKFVLTQVARGKSAGDREQAFHARFDASAVKSIDVDGSPSIGPANAPETIVVWADFECPMCATFEPMLEETAKRFPGKVRIVFKNYPISHHAHAQTAARAGIAAMKLGKFWELGHLMFENQDKLENKDLEGYARRCGIDPQKLHAEMASPQTSDRLARDVKQADELGLDGTPFVFFNGRLLDLSLIGPSPVDDLADWVALDIALAEGHGPSDGSSKRAPDARTKRP